MRQAAVANEAAAAVADEAAALGGEQFAAGGGRQARAAAEAADRLRERAAGQRGGAERLMMPCPTAPHAPLFVSQQVRGRA
jgi:hypothetical protein